MSLIWKITIILVTSTLNFSLAADSIEIKFLDVPPNANRNQDLMLYCNYDIKNQTLESVQWYFNSTEIWRYTKSPSVRKEDLTQGTLKLNMEKSNATVLALKKIPLEATGTYGCLVHTDAPHFDLVQKEAFMEVVVIPKESPKLEWIKDPDGFETGNNMTINCTSPLSKPASKLTFRANGKIVESGHITDFPVEKTEDGLFLSKAALLLRSKSSLFIKGEVKIMCKSQIKAAVRESALAVIKSSGCVIRQSIGIILITILASIGR